MKFYTLIHVCAGEQSIHNNSFNLNFDAQISLYLNCAKQFHRSLAPEGIELCILTNDAAFLERLNKDKYPIVIIQLDFVSKFPSGLKFYSAHFKLEVFDYLATLSDDYLALVDSDMVCITAMPAAFKNCIDQKLPLYYDITDQVVPAYGMEAIITDKERISRKKSIGLWAGGEFIAGPPSFFKTIAEEIDGVRLNYLDNFSSFHHQGDEVLTSVAIEAIKTTSAVPVFDAGALSIVGRYWGYVPLHCQKPLKAYANHFLLHLPSDKKFVVRLQADELKGLSFFKKYKSHLSVARVADKVFKNIKPYAKRIRKKFAN